MLRMFFVTFFFAIAGMAAATSVASANNCPRCDAYRLAVAAGTHPTSTALACIYLEQVGEDAVPLFLHDSTGALLNADPSNPLIPRENHRKVKQESDSYCIGKHFLEEVLAAGGWVDLCNGADGDGWTSTRIEGDVLRQIIDHGTAPQTLATTVCLMDATECDLRLAAHNVPA